MRWNRGGLGGGELAWEEMERWNGVERSRTKGKEAEHSRKKQITKKNRLSKIATDI